MRLSKVIYSGFKSFADTTVLEASSKLVAIVGPNGCGKSNIIDGIRWVLGEGSAKSLRGTSMEDVIFTGTDSRPPSDRASVELIFDNSDGSLQGVYAGYKDISIKRELSRNGESCYYLNSQRCRKKDITDLLLGTGLGSWSYAIIQQGMVSRIVESKPEDVRSFLEEAAGISKFKERKKESIAKIALTKEKLDRLKDIREELGSQLAKLDKQSKQAIKFQKLQKEKITKKAILCNFKINSFTKLRDEHLESMKQLKHELEQINSEYHDYELKLSKERTSLANTQEQLHVKKSEAQAIVTICKQIDLQIQYSKEQCNSNLEEQSILEQQCSDLTEQLKLENNKLEGKISHHSLLKPKYDSIVKELELSKQSTEQAESMLQDWQQRFDARQLTYNQLNQSLEYNLLQSDLIKNQIEEMESKSTQLHALVNRLEEELHASQHFRFTDEIALDEEALTILISTHEQLKESLSQLQLKRNEMQTQITLIQEEKLTLSSMLASLQALQVSGQDHTKSQLLSWLQSHSRETQDIFSNYITVESPWERAVELVLSKQLDAFVSNDVQTIATAVNDIPCGEVMFVIGAFQKSIGDITNRLSSKVQAPNHVVTLLDKIHITQSFESALALINQLPSDESVITQDSIWVQHNSINVLRDSVDSPQGPIQRARERQSVENAIKDLQHKLENLQNNLISNSGQINFYQQEFEANTKAITEIRLRLDKLKSEQFILIKTVTENKVTSESSTKNLTEINLLLKAKRNELLENIKDIEQKEDERSSLAQDLKLLLQEKEAIILTIKNSRNIHEEKILTCSKISSDLEHEQLLCDSIKSLIATIEQQLAQTKQRISVNANTIISLQEKIPKLEEEKIKHYTDNDLIQVACVDLQKLFQLNCDQIAIFEQQLATLLQNKESLQAFIHEKQLLLQETQLQITQYEEQKSSLNITISVPELTDQTEETLTLEIEKIETSLGQFGAINMVAMEEYSELLDRKNILDTQCDDVIHALKTLQETIDSINKETDESFHSVFSAVSINLNKIANQLFNGGSARLELNDDLEYPGVSILIQPPGKKITHIHLLSGGEKSLAAIAFVVSMFTLNPAPFCLMDEVDAALDEVNVERFCVLIREMSKTVQHLVITHHKTTMANADQLLGVTMSEAGVTKLVGVNLREATAFAIV
ncbi:MAG: chromosome segregation protein SMC [Methylacidiphilales bacterium]|nr:chromosome segregation protein SMC [Candidatus Methylacidiphilales bacterium]